MFEAFQVSWGINEKAVVGQPPDTLTSQTYNTHCLRRKEMPKHAQKCIENLIKGMSKICCFTIERKKCKGYMLKIKV